MFILNEWLTNYPNINYYIVQPTHSNQLEMLPILY